MPAARIVTRHYDEAVPLAERLQQLGYTVEIFDPGQLRLSTADLEINLELVGLKKALRLAEKRARSADADVYVARGIFPPPVAENQPVSPPRAEASPAPLAPTDSPAEDESPEPQRIGEAMEKTLVEFGSAFSGARAEIADSLHFARTHVHDVAQRISGQISSRRAQAEAIREQRRRRREEALQRRHQERERAAARHAADLATLRLAEEEDRRRRAEQFAIDRGREEEERKRREQQQRRAAEEHAALLARMVQEQRVAEAQRQAELQRAQAEAGARMQREQELARLAEQEKIAASHRLPARPVHHIAEPDAVAAEVAARAHRSPQRLRPPAPRRPLRSPRDRQWQRAALYASLGALIVMLGFAFAVRQAPPSRAAQIVPQSSVHEDVPFGKATAASSPAQPAPRLASPEALPQRDASLPQPAPHRAVPQSQDSASDVAEDTVIVHHYVTPKHAHTNTRTTAGVLKISDME